MATSGQHRLGGEDPGQGHASRDFRGGRDGEQHVESAAVTSFGLTLRANARRQGDGHSASKQPLTGTVPFSQGQGDLCDYGNASSPPPQTWKDKLFRTGALKHLSFPLPTF